MLYNVHDVHVLEEGFKLELAKQAIQMYYPTVALPCLCYQDFCKLVLLYIINYLS